jgi:hypothetical protein
MTDAVQERFAAAQRRWRRVIEVHRLAPPDAGFSQRLADLADAAREDALACREADAAGYEWQPHRGKGQPPPELQPGSGRRGPERLWQRFDAAVAALNRASTGKSLSEVAAAYELLSEIAGELAGAVEQEDRAAGLLAPAKRRLGA